MTKRMTGNPLPRHAHIEVSGMCQLKCKYCSKKLRKSTKTQMTIDEFRTVLCKIETLTNITLTIMNESLLNPDIDKMVFAAKQQGVKVGIPTNGVFLPEELQHHLLEAGLDSLTFSVDTLDAANFKLLRYPAELNIVITNMKQFIEKKNKWNSGCKVYVASIIHPDLLAEMEAFIKYWSGMGVDGIKFRFPHTWSKDNLTESLSVNKRNAIVRLFRLKKKFGKIVSFYYQPFFFSKIKCPRVFNSIAIKVDGKVVPCCLQASDPEYYELGNILMEPISDIWNGTKYQEFRKPFLRGRWPDACNGCTVLSGLNGNPEPDLLSTLIHRASNLLYCIKP